MRVLQGDPTAVGAPYMADDDPALDRISTDEARDLGMSAGLRVVESATALSFIQRNAPAILMRPGGAAALHQSGKAETDVGRHIGIHSQQFAQAAIPLDGCYAC